ncbi:hypothetical protein NBRC10513v2_006545 [Rhodotorula toruloides]|uniref:RNA recognition motif domain containing protein n=1 Tax=Rhodotorula toruloides TaxID=5286 RepID=A0A2T0A1Y5_RHOTO|nr:hypothetical protein AAT19DRAFT_9344 [Rhodotorula toruloides]
MLPLSTLQSLQTPPRRPTPQNTLRGRTDPLSSPAQTPRASPSSAIARRSSLPAQGAIVDNFAKLSLSTPARRLGAAGDAELGGKSSLDAKVDSGGDSLAGSTGGLMLENVFPDLPFARPQGRRGTVSQPFPSTPLALSQSSHAVSSQLTSPRSTFAPTTSASRQLPDPLSPLDQTPSQSISFSSSAFKFDSPLSSFSTPNTSFAFSPLALRPSQAKSGPTKIMPAALDSDEEDLDDPPSPTGYISHSSPFYSHPNEPIEALKWSFPPLHTDSELSTPPGPLSPGEQADVRDSWEDEDDLGVEVELRFAARRESSPFVDEGVPADEEDAEEDFACGGCGAPKNEAFVRLTPCGHPACPTCMNALVNASAHKPPRPSNCFACATYVESFEPAVEAVRIENGGGGLVEALFEQLAKEKREREQEAVDGTNASEDEEQRRSKRSGRSKRRSSVVRRQSAATAFAGSKARFIDESDFEYATSPVGYSGVSLALDTCDEEDDTVHSPTNRRSASNIISPGSMSTRSDDVGVFGPRKLSANVSAEREPIQTAMPADIPPADISPADSDLPSSATRYNTEWPVVRLDNVPWSVTVKEIEAWLPKEKVLASEVDGERKATLAVHLLCNRTDGRTLNQAYLECASLAAAQNILRACDGTYLGSRPVHVSLSSQSELLQTIFPNYTPGFDGLTPVPVCGRKSAPVPLLLQTELTGLLELCKLQSAHSNKVPERPFFNIVTLLEKMPWEFKYSYNAAAIVRLFNSACAAIEILALVKSRVPRWSYILRTLFDAIARCPVFRPTQVEKAAELARAAGRDVAQLKPDPSTITFFGHKKQLRTKVAVTPIRSPFGVTGVFDSFQATSTPAADIANFTPSSLAQSCVTTAAKSFPRLASCIDFDVSRADSKPPATTSTPAEQLSAPVQPSELASPARPLRRTSLAKELGLDNTVVDSVAKALGIDLVE